MDNYRYKKSNNCAYLIQYHIIWCPKFRYKVLKLPVKHHLKEILHSISNKYEFEILELEIMEDHIHLSVGTKPTISPTDVIRILKSISAKEVFKEFPKLKVFYKKCGSLWAKGFFISTIGKVSEDTVRRYILEQNSK